MSNEHDDDGTRAMLELRRSRGMRMLAFAAAVAGVSAWWINNGLEEKGDALLIWGPGGVGLVIAAAVAIAGVVMLVTKPKPPTDW
jgi:hypothetical protein